MEYAKKYLYYQSQVTDHARENTAACSASAATGRPVGLLIWDYSPSSTAARRPAASREIIKGVLNLHKDMGLVNDVLMKRYCPRLKAIWRSAMCVTLLPAPAS